jgi:hypothetical protein
MTGESMSGDVEDVTEGKTEDGSYRYGKRVTFKATPRV